MTRVPLLCSVLCLTACGSDAQPQRSAPAAAEAPTALMPPAPTGPCRVMGTTRLAPMPERPRLVALAIGQVGGLLLTAEAGGRVQALSLDSSGGADGELRELALPDALGLLAFAPVGDRFVAVTAGTCAGSGRCLRGWVADAAGLVVGTPTETPLAGPPLNLRRRVVGDELLLAISVEHAPPRLIHLLPSGTGLTSTVTELHRGPWPAETNATILSLFGDERWGVLYRVGPTEAPTSHVLLALSDGPHEAPTLEHALAVDAATFDGDGVLALVSYEFFRPKLHRLHLDGSAHVEAREVLPNDSLPAPFRERRRATLEHGGALTLVFTSAAGDRLGPPLRVDADGAAPADVARLDDHYVVALHREGHLDAVHIACDAGARP